MIPIIFGLIVFAAIFYSIKANDEKKLREKQEIELRQLKFQNEYSSKKQREEEKIKELISSIKELEKPKYVDDERKLEKVRKFIPEFSEFQNVDYYYTRLESEYDNIRKVISILEYDSPLNFLEIRFTITKLTPYQEIFDKIEFKNHHTIENKKILNSYKAMKSIIDL